MWLGRARWLALGAAAALLVAHAWTYNFVTDDAYISFVFSRNLAEHGQLAFNVGQPVEGYTNFLWTAILGVLMILGLRPEITSLVLGAACAIGTLYVTMRVVDRALGRVSWWSIVPAILLAASSGFACWTSGGLETQLFTLLVTAAIDGVVAAAADPGNGRPLRRAAICLALASMTRPEGPMLVALFGAIYLARRALLWRIDRRALDKPPWLPSLAHELRAAGWFVLLWLPWFAWRWWYYGYPFPNTYYVKASGPWASPELAHEMFANGLYYVWVWVQQVKLLYILPIVALGCVAWPPRSPRFLLVAICALTAVVYLAYAVTVGGDFMGLHRFIMPVFVLVAILVALGFATLHELLARAMPELAARIVAGVVAGALVVAFAWTQRELTRRSLTWGNFTNDRGIDTPAFLIAYTEDRAAIGRAMAGCFTPDDFSIVGGAGAQPYYGEMRAIDVFGLVSERIAHEEPRIRARAGHTKFGSDVLLAAYDPTFVFSCYAIHGKPKTSPLPCGGFWRSRGYEEVTLHVPGMREQGEYYTFLAKQSRHFQCPGRVE